MDKLFIKRAVESVLEKSIESVFAFAHEMAETKSGDITPDQDSRLEILRTQLSDLILEQTFQNVETESAKMFTVIRFDQWGNVANTYTEEISGIMAQHLDENRNIIYTMSVGDKIESTSYNIIRVN